MRIVQIPKRSGGTRTIYVQSPREKHRYRLIGSRLAELAAATPEAGVMHGFVAGRSPVTNALAHVGFNYSVSMDLRDFFDSVTDRDLRIAGCPTHLAVDAMVDGAARQGLSSSPAAANLAGSLLDRDILFILSPGMVYTRYADDLSISGNDLPALLSVRDRIPRLASDRGWKVKASKTRVQSQAFGDRVICGIAVGKTGIHVPRNVKRKLRAAQHQHPGSNKTRGLAEWCKLTPPSGGGQSFGKWAATRVNEETRKVFAK